MSGKPQTIDEYLASLSDEKRAALETLRGAISAFYPGAFPVEAHHDELKAYDTSKGTIRFRADNPLPATLVRKLVKTRIAEQAAQRSLKPTSDRR